MSRALGPWLLIAPLPLLLAPAYAAPFLGVARWGVTEPEPGLAQYARVVSDPLVASVAARTARVCAVVTAITVALAYALAYARVFGGPRLRAVVGFGVLIPFWISTLTRAFGWLVLLFNRGIVNTALMDAGLIDFPLALVRNELSVVIGMVHFLVPFATLPLASSMRRVDGRVLTAARGMGAGRARIFWTVLLPLTRAGVVGAALLTFIFALGFFVTPAILGGGRSVLVAELIFVQVFQTVNWGLAGAVSVTLVALVAALLAVFARLVRPRALAG